MSSFDAGGSDSCLPLMLGGALRVQGNGRVASNLKTLKIFLNFYPILLLTINIILKIFLYFWGAPESASDST